jgi:hypothetical protein
MVGVAFWGVSASFGAAAQDSAEKADAAASPPPPEHVPLPFHCVEGFSGAFATASAYFANPPKEGDIFGLPSVGGIYVNMGHGRFLEALTITEVLWNRLELGYAFNNFDMGDLPRQIKDATGMTLHEHTVQMHNFNARLQLIHDSDFGQKWMPAVTFGVHYKYNPVINDVNRDLGGLLRNIGIKDDQGVDFTLYASKLLPQLPRPVIINAGLRATRAAHIGLLGFTDAYKLCGEGNICVMVTDRIIIAGEYRMQPNQYQAVGNLLQSEDDWWTVCVGFIINKHATLSAGYAHFGRVLNHEANDSLGVALKYEF